MVPQLSVSSTVGTAIQPVAGAAGASTDRTQSSLQAEIAKRLETARAVEPAKAAEPISAFSVPERRDLNPPDPDAPAGPPPAFEASILDRQREQALEFRAPERGEPSFAASDAPVAGPLAAELGVEAVDGPGKPDSLIGAEGVERPEEDDERGPREPARPESRGPYDVPPSAEFRAEREIATIRRIETPYDTATVDVSR